ncbi:L-rhamnose mutarotase [Massilibacteroides sp.]|uniref:L-rhamnose mutarotase n=1 Tax=Massilibacteroides sp. TaxID=2034766 RepID=UPI00260845B9|nr:L-rhamnose mutarotase [Massilibacteroides sp.]MDD4514507.1 L-rhamnose mutarotase [Massilibacteroides sp.]
MEKSKGYVQKACDVPVKRYCQTLELKNDPQLIEEYVKRHSELHHWPEIVEGIRSVGILEMEIYLLGTTLFMIVETPLDFEWERAFNKLAELPRQSEWETYMSIFQQADSTATSSEKWTLMDRIFHLYEKK